MRGLSSRPKESAMNLTMYQASAPRFASMLGNLSRILDKAAAHCEANKIDPAVLLASRLYPNMFPLVRQVQIACDNGKNCVARLAGVEIPEYEDTEKTIPELQARLAKAIDFIHSIRAEQMEGAEDRDIHLKLGPLEVDWKGMQYLLGFALPNFHFHLVTAYDILRHNGVALEKPDYIGNP